MAFKSSEKPLQHSQADIACDVVRDESGQEGISHEQLMKLKSRKRSREASSEHDTWINMYKILFPDDYLIPSPYFQRGNSGKGQESLLTAFREHVSRELPRLIRPRLEESVDATIREALGPDVLEGLVRDIYSQVLSTFPQHNSESPAAMSGEKHKGEASLPTELFPQLALPGSNSLALSDASTFDVEPNASAAWGDNVVEASSVSDLFNFDDFRDEYAAWLGQADGGE
ncbi:hypothetical protein LA080_015623 [Diaporthe eres]|nr:hypothetical protein LA080_015623 [Diaporthe eres]